MVCSSFCILLYSVMRCLSLNLFLIYLFVCFCFNDILFYSIPFNWIWFCPFPDLLNIYIYILFDFIMPPPPPCQCILILRVTVRHRCLLTCWLHLSHFPSFHTLSSPTLYHVISLSLSRFEIKRMEDKWSAWDWECFACRWALGKLPKQLKLVVTGLSATGNKQTLWNLWLSTDLPFGASKYHFRRRATASPLAAQQTGSLCGIFFPAGLKCFVCVCKRKAVRIHPILLDCVSLSFK